MVCTHLIEASRFQIDSKAGSLCVEFSEKGLVRMDFGVTDFLSAPSRNLIESFQQWIAQFNGATPKEQWAMLDLGGTEFQRAVWQELLKIPFGTTKTYGEIAAAIGRPKASRAVGSAVGANPICILVPCHRVLPASGQSGNYRWGPAIKRALLDAEQVDGSNLESLFK